MNASTDPSSGPHSGPWRRFRLIGAFLLVSFAICWIVIALLRVGEAGGPTIALAVGVMVTVELACFGAVFALMAVRRKVTRMDATPAPGEAPPTGLMRRISQLADHLNELTDDAFGTRRELIRDAAALTTANLNAIPSRIEALDFLRLCRPSQAADFPLSAAFDALPEWARDAIVLMDLQRDLELRGERALRAPDGFYHHPPARRLEVARRTGNAELVACLQAAEAGQPGAAQRLLAALEGAVS